MTSDEGPAVGVEPSLIWGPNRYLLTDVDKLEETSASFHDTFRGWRERGILTEMESNRELQELKKEFFRAYDQLQVVAQKWIFEW